MASNFYMYFVTALIPLVVGAIYYHPKVVGTTWMKVNGFKEKDLEGANMMVIFGLSFLLGTMFSFLLSQMVIHQTGVVGTFMNPENPREFIPKDLKMLQTILAEYGGRYRSFGHGAIHGFIISVLFALPLIAINAMFERRGGKYILIHWAYWAISLILMGGVLCATLEFAPITS